MSFNRLSWPLLAAAVAIVIGGAMVRSEASFRLRIEEIGTSNGVVLTDVGSPGTISYNGSMNSGDTSTLKLTNGLRIPSLAGRLCFTDIELFSFDQSASGVGRLRILVEPPGFTQGPLGSQTLQSAQDVTVTGPAGTSVTFQSWINASNLRPGIGPDSASPTILSSITGLPPAVSTAVYGGAGLLIGSGAFSDMSGTSLMNGGTYPSRFSR